MVLVIAMSLALGTTAFAAVPAPATMATNTNPSAPYQTVYSKYEALISQVSNTTDKKTLSALLKSYKSAMDNTKTARDNLITALEKYDLDITYADNSRKLDTDAIFADINNDISVSSTRTKLRKLVTLLTSALKKEETAISNLESKLKEILGNSTQVATTNQSAPSDWTQFKDLFKNLNTDKRQSLEKMVDQLSQNIQAGKTAINAAPQGAQRDRVTQEQNAEIQKLMTELEQAAANAGITFELPRQWHS